MSLSKETALEILGLPIFASEEQIVLRYKILALQWFPEAHDSSEHSIQEFTNISKAVFRLVFNQRGEINKPLSESGMYAMFQTIFFGGTPDADLNDEWVDVDSEEILSDNSDKLAAEIEDDIKAEDNAQELIEEEEREKSIAEKRRSKKKRRKERKKMLNNGTENGLVKDDSSLSPKKNKEILPSESEEDLDPSSAFVSVVARKHMHKKKIDTNTKESPVKITTNTTRKSPKKGTVEEDQQSVVNRSSDLAVRGNEMAALGYFPDAIELFTESIKLTPSDHRFYGNRSYCFDRLHQYERALDDAEKSIKLCSTWAKGYFRKGRALLGQKKYSLAEKCFKQVLKLDTECEEAVSELHKAKMLQIMVIGYSKDQAECAIAKCGSVPDALNFLLSEGVTDIHIQTDMDIFISDDENDEVCWNSKQNTTKITPQPYDIKTDPTNPEGHTSLWVGNVQLGVTEKKLGTMFAKFGDVLSTKVMPEKFCAFINYKSKSAPGHAMKAYQGFSLGGSNLLIRFPNLPGETTKKPVKKARR